MNEIDRFWLYAEKSFFQQGLAKGTIRGRRITFRLYVKLTNMKSISQLEDLELARRFIHLRRGTIKDTTLQANLNVMRDIIQHLIEIQDYEDTPYHFKKNVFKYLTKKTQFSKDHEHFKPRSTKEFKIWIKLIHEPKFKALYILYTLGLRRSEPLGLRKSQFELDKNYIANVLRKGNRIHTKLGLPKFVIPFLEDFLTNFDDDDLPFQMAFSTIARFNHRHYNRLLELKSKLERRTNNPYWREIFEGIKLIERNGKITPHQGRTTWDTIAEKNRMRESYRRYHLNHRLEGSDDTYIQIGRQKEAFEDYLKELNRCSPNFLV